MIRLGCIADDFTGAGDAASFIKNGGLRTVYINGEDLDGVEIDDGFEAVVIALKCRSVPAPEAVRQVLAAAGWLIDRGTEHLYFKYCSTFDSTEKGNIGPVTDALMELLGVPFTVLCPSLPVNGRTVKDGVLYVNGVRLEDSPMRYHPLNPMTESYIPSLMEKQSRYRCLSLTQAQIREAGAQLAAVRREDRVTAAVDYVTDEDGAHIARRFAHLRLLTGGSGLLEHLASEYREKGAASAPEMRRSASPGRGRLLLAGSCSQMTLRQIAAYKRPGRKTGRSIRRRSCAGRRAWTHILRSWRGRRRMFSFIPRIRRTRSASTRRSGRSGSPGCWRRPWGGWP